MSTPKQFALPPDPKGEERAQYMVKLVLEAFDKPIVGVPNGVLRDNQFVIDALLERMRQVATSWNISETIAREEGECEGRAEMQRKIESFRASGHTDAPGAPSYDPHDTCIIIAGGRRFNFGGHGDHMAAAVALEAARAAADAEKR